MRFDTDDGRVHAVDNLSFTLDERQVLGVVGESGCGKSVSVMSFLRLLPSTAHVTGSAEFDGVDLLSAPLSAVRRVRGRKIAFVFQEPMTSLNPAFRIGNQIGEVLSGISASGGRTLATARSSCSSSCAYPRPSAGSTSTRISCRAGCASA